MKTLSIALLALLTLTGCGTYFENRVACTVDGKESHLVSKWGAFSIGAKIAESDAAIICKRGG
jgi:hypothetical protein